MKSIDRILSTIITPIKSRSFAIYLIIPSLLLIVFVCGAAVRDGILPEVRASKFVLVGPDGMDRVRIGFDNDGNLSQTFLDSKGGLRLGFTVLKNGTGWVSLYDTANNPKVQLSVDNNGVSDLLLVDKDNKPRLSLGTSELSGAGLRIMDKNGTTRVSLNDNKENGSSLVFSDAAGNARVTTEHNEINVSQIIFTDENGVNRFKAVQSNNNGPAIFYKGHNDKLLYNLTVRSNNQIHQGFYDFQENPVSQFFYPPYVAPNIAK